MAELVDAALAKIAVDLAWRGPNLREYKFVVLPREMAEALAQEIERLRRVGSKMSE